MPTVPPEKETRPNLYAQRQRLHDRERELWDQGDFYRAKIVFIARVEIQDAIDLLETGGRFSE